jgi:hypothetical protein
VDVEGTSGCAAYFQEIGRIAGGKVMKSVVNRENRRTMRNVPKDGKRELSAEQRKKLLGTLKVRFEKNVERHKGVKWAEVEAKLKANAEKLWSLCEMERTGGEPDVVGHDGKTGEYIFYDCSTESSKGRRSVCYDGDGQRKRIKEGLHPGSAMDMATAMGIELLTEEEYGELQKLGSFDTKTSSWMKTPAEIRELGGAIFAARHFGRVFVSANTAPCFFQGRGFRGSLRV